MKRLCAASVVECYRMKRMREWTAEAHTRLGLDDELSVL
ncbi:MAG: hypothetical protein OJF49_002243 [Ktedonobacterales bacterium]|nr:MAG: hypothetical protein OJF49_002243 [Ktedonobacterales bacterium]